MATVVYELNIEFTASPGENIFGWLMTSSSKLRSEIESFGYDLQPMRRGEYDLCKIREPEGSKRTEAVRAAVLSAGYIECDRTIIPRGQRRTHFAFKKVRTFSKEDIENAPLLLLGVKGLQRIADWKETTKAGYVLKAGSRLKNNLSFGWLDIVMVPYVSAEGKGELATAGLDAIDFEPAVFDLPEKAAKKLYRLTSNIKLPRSLTRVRNLSGETMPLEDRENGHYWDDGGYVPPVLKYRFEDIKALPRFDIALTCEQIGARLELYRQYCIVSQSLRKQLEKMKVRTVEFIPVDLV